MREAFPFPEPRPTVSAVPTLAIPVEAQPEETTGRYQVRILVSSETRPYVVIDTENADTIVEPHSDYRSRVAAQTAADRLNRSAAAAGSRTRDGR